MSSQNLPFGLRNVMNHEKTKEKNIGVAPM
jgi:hypothetical protein